MSTTTTSHTPSSAPRIVVIGAGCGGITFAIALQRKYGYKNYIIYEKASDIGGTWRENTYPGCSSDVGMSFFSLSTDLRNWPSTHAYQPDILSYWRSLVHAYHLPPHIHLNHHVLSTEWDDSAQVYRVTVQDQLSKELKIVEAEIVVSAIGVLDVPHWPEEFGGDRGSKFSGRVFHSARWDESVELRGKNVAVIGNGPSAIQLIPRISQDPSVSVTNFIRTPSWIIPPMRETYSSFRVWLSGAIPGALRAARIGNFLTHELSYFLIFSNSVTRKFVQWLSTLYMRSKAPEKYFRKLIPKHDIGCKRLLFDTEYLDSLHRPNVSVNFDGINEIVHDGIVTKTGETMPFDVIILATGFVTDDYPIPIKGKSKQTVGDYYRASGGPTAYIGTSVPGFPNFFTLVGPNIATGFTSVIYAHEIQTNYILQLIKPVLDGKVSSLEVTSQATNEYNVKIQKRLSNSVFMQCLSWYRTGQTGKVSNIFPGSGTLMWWWLRRPVWDHYLAANGKRWQEERKARQRRKIVAGVAVVGLFAAGFAYAEALAQVVTSLDWSSARFLGRLESHLTCLFH